jgi:hypothetical protein
MIVKAALVLAALLISATPSLAALICGSTQMRHYGIQDKRFKLAKNWARLLPHTTAHPGVVVVQRRNGRDSAGNPGYHVARIVAVRGACSALVADEKGQYERDICARGAVYVDPNGNAATTMHAKKRKHAKRHRHHSRYAQEFSFIREFPAH